MKIRNLLEATFEKTRISPNQLNTLQLRTYNRIRHNEVDIDSADDRELEIILDLIDLGVLDYNGDIVSDVGDGDDTFDTDADFTGDGSSDDEFARDGSDVEFDSYVPDDDDEYSNDDIDFSVVT